MHEIPHHEQNRGSPFRWRNRSPLTISTKRPASPNAPGSVRQKKGSEDRRSEQPISNERLTVRKTPTEGAAMKPISKIELSPSTQLRKAVFGDSFRAKCFGFALGFAFLTASALADGPFRFGYFKFDNFPRDHAAFTDDGGQGLRGVLGFPFSEPGSLPGPSGLPGDLAVSFDGNGGLVVDDSADQILNILTPPLTLECWVRSTNSSQIGVHRALISYGIPGGPPVEGLVRGGYKLGIDPTGNILFTLFAVVDVLSGVPFPFDGQWHHVAASYSFPDDGVHFYLDGAEVAFVPEINGITPPETRHLDIGDQATGTARFDGDIDRVRISTVGLTADQLDSAADTVKPVGSDTAIFFNFDEASPPYQGQGRSPAGVAVPAAEWVMNYAPYQSSGGPRPSPGGPVKVSDTPSAAAGDLAVGFGVTQFGGMPAADMAAVWDSGGVLNLNGDWTLEAWVKINPDFEGDQDVVFYYGDPGHGYSLSLNYAADRLSASLQVTTLGIAELPSDPGLAVVGVDVWQHLAVVHKTGQSVTYFTNGVEAESRAYTGGTRLAEITKVLYIGAQWDGSLPFTGLIDRIRISNSALTAAQLDSDPGKPSVPLRLTIAQSESNVILSWPEDPFAFDSLEFSDTLPNSNWSPELTTPVVEAGQQSVTVPITGSARYYRLNRSF